MPLLNSFCNHEAFSQRYLKPLLVEPLQDRLNNLPDPAHFLVGTDISSIQVLANEKSGVHGAHTGRRARFVRTADGWFYGHHVLRKWQQTGEWCHQRESEHDLQYTVTVGDAPDMTGVPRLTVDVQATLMRYERDAVSQLLASGGHADLGAGWARASLHWSLRLQLIVDRGGRAHLVSQARSMPPVTDAGKTGPYIATSPLAHLLQPARLFHTWEHGAASLAAVQDYLVSRLAAAIEPVLMSDFDA